MSSPVGPVCHIPANTTAQTPGAKNIPGLPAPAAPNLASLTSTVNSLRDIINVLMGPSIVNNVVVNNNNGSGAQVKPGDFSQKSISYAKVKIYQNNDPSTGNYVEVNVVDGLTMGNSSGGSWKYTRDSSQDNPGS